MKPLHLPLMIIAIVVLIVTSCNTQTTSSAETQVLQTAQPSTSTQEKLVSDFAPCAGPPSGKTTTPRRSIALMAYSTDGLNFERPANPKDGILVDGAGVPDAVILPSGRILFYYIDGCRSYDPKYPERSVISVAVSDKQGIPGSWIYKYVKMIGIPTTGELGPAPVDPNVVLLPDGNLRIFATMFRDQAHLGAYSFLSTDGGFTYSFEGMRYDDIADPENYRFSDSNWQIFTGGPRGWAMSTDGGNTFENRGAFPVPQGVVHEIAVTEKPGEYRAYLSTANGIKSYTSVVAPWTTWTEESGYRLQVDSTTGLESCEVAVPTVLRLGPGNYLMMYLSVYPGCGCQEDPVCP